MDNLSKSFDDSQQLSYVELNLETWRQLWRVLEMSDVILLIADIRCPVSVLTLLLLSVLFFYYFDNNYLRHTRTSQ